MFDLIRTVEGDIAPGALGTTDAHDHLLLVSPAIEGTPLEDEADATREAAALRSAGARALVQWTPPGMGRRADALGRIARAAELQLVAATGLHRERHYADGGDLRWPATLETDALVELFVEELTVGMRNDDGTRLEDAACAGVIKVAGGYHSLDAHEQRALAAAGAAHRLTGAAICVHLEVGTHGHAVLDALASAGAPPEHVVLGHLARNPDVHLHRELAARGPFLAYDGPGRGSHQTDWRLGDLVLGMFESGFGGQLMVGADTLSAEASTAAGGGPGAPGLMRDTVPRLAGRVGDDAMHAVLVENPARAFAWGSGR